MIFKLLRGVTHQSVGTYGLPAVALFSQVSVCSMLIKKAATVARVETTYRLNYIDFPSQRATGKDSSS